MEHCPKITLKSMICNCHGLPVGLEPEPKRNPDMVDVSEPSKWSEPKPQEKGWCEHIEKGYFYDFQKLPLNSYVSEKVWSCVEFKVCPICAAPRPEEVGIEEEIKTVIKKSIGGYGNFVFERDAKHISKQVIEFLKSRGWKSG